LSPEFLLAFAAAPIAIKVITVQKIVLAVQKESFDFAGRLEVFLCSLGVGLLPYVLFGTVVQADVRATTRNNAMIFCMNAFIV
jgi:hypothetical protein